MVRARRVIRSAVRGTAAAGLGLLLLLALIEGGLRLSMPLFFSPDWELANLPGRYRFRNAHGDVPVEINQLGMRGPQPAIPKPQGTRRMLVIGDSMTWGEAVPYEATYPEAARRALGALGCAVEAVNLSRPGIGLTEYLRYWRRVGIKLQPDAVVIGLYLGNDMLSVTNPYLVESASSAPRALARPPLEALAEGVRLRWRALRILAIRLRPEPADLFDLWFGRGPRRAAANPLHESQLLPRAQAEGVSPSTARERLDRLPADVYRAALDYALDPWLVSAAIVHPQSIRDLQELTEARVVRSWGQAAAVLDELTGAIRAAGATPVVLAIPRAEQVAERYAREAQDLGFDLPPEVARLARQQEALSARLSPRGVTFVDPLATMREAEREAGDRLYFRYDVHMTSRGNDVLGRSLARALRQAGVLCP
jgi:lysophospholipase L1-like esterase